MREFLFGAVLLIAIIMIFTAALVAVRAWLLQRGRGQESVLNGGSGPAAEPRPDQLPRICKVLSSRSIAPLMREIILALPEGEQMEFSPGQWVAVTAPPFSLSYSDYALPSGYRSAWDRMGIWGLAASSGRRETRPFWIANTVADGSEWLVLLVRLALPPPDRPGLPPGKVSTWAFGLRAGDAVEIHGPCGSRVEVPDATEELVLIGAGQGLAPIRAMLSTLLADEGAQRRITLWVGARSEADLIYRDEFDRLAATHPAFTWAAALSEPAGPVDAPLHAGFVHELLRREFLEGHPAPEECEYLLYGPELMMGSVNALLDDYGVEGGRIHVNGIAADRGEGR